MMPLYFKKALRDLRKDLTGIFLLIISISVCLATMATLLNTNKLFSSTVQETAKNQQDSVYFYTNPFQNELPDLRSINGIQHAQSLFQSKVRVEFNGSAKNFELQTFPSYTTGEETNHPGPPFKPGIYLEKTTMDHYHLTKGDMISVKLPGKKQKNLQVAGQITDYAFIPAKFTGLGRGYISPESMKTLGISSQKNTIKITLLPGEYKKNGDNILQHAKEKLKEQGITVYRTELVSEALTVRKQMTDTVFLLLIMLGTLAVGLAVILVIHFFYRLTAKKKQEMSILKVFGAQKKDLIWKYCSVTLGLIGIVIFLLTFLISACLSFYFSKTLIQDLNIGQLYFHYSRDVLFLIGILSFLVPSIAALVPINRVLKIPIVQGLKNGTKPYQRAEKRDSGFSLFLLSVRNSCRKKVQLLTNILMLSFGGAVIISCVALNNSLTSTLKEMQGFWKHDMQWDIRTQMDISDVSRIASNTNGVYQAESWTGRNAEVVLSSNYKSANALLLAIPRESNMIQPIVKKGFWLDSLPSNSIVINSDFQPLAGNVQPGESISLKIGNKKKTWTIGGIIQGQLTGPSIYMAEDDYHSWIDGQKPNRVIVKLYSNAKKQSAQTINEIETLFNRNNISIEAFDTAQNMNNRPEQIISMVLYCLLVTGILFSAVGMLNLIAAMGINVFERRHEIGLIRAVGGSRMKIYQLLLGEGLFIAMISWGLSAALSYPLQLLLNDKIGNSLINSPLPSSFSPQGLSLWLIVSLALGIIASVIPAKKTADLPIKELIAGK
ncbi:ABC transporter permease [Peribacillus saganii]|uniref:ABC transporter permease n=1 Tax=Peribacillus saganii TaxID=2303992 RepID=A0A372LAG6_9BACI|nr:FtsX-like permease family protein [Peribacillus saganii]RFU62251.1 ABC transporter permease [Peribacillus saganii]